MVNSIPKSAFAIDWIAPLTDGGDQSSYGLCKESNLKMASAHMSLIYPTEYFWAMWRGVQGMANVWDLNEHMFNVSAWILQK